MGKKVKKGTNRNVPKSSPKVVPDKIIPSVVVDSVPDVKEARICPHFHKGLNLDNVSVKMASLESHKCEDCREGTVDKRASRGKHGKKKGGGSASESKSIWVCLECGQFTCGGIGFPTAPNTHATRHSKQNRHPLAVNFANPNLWWCFPCSTLLPVKSLEENGEHKDVLSEVVKVLKIRPASLDLENVYFGSGSIISDSKSINIPSGLEATGAHKVKGLLNLGNTCFLNSILQNLLALDRLRDHLLKLESGGPLAASMKKLFVEINNPLTGGKSTVNPRPIFNSICATASQFKGYQQQDSHEVLRFLLDGLSTEESATQNSDPKPSSTFVDAMFGGQISSSVSCLECGHTSVVYEPYLDLSLPLPTRKVPPKKMPPVSSPKKSKPPPKRRGKHATKINRTFNTTTAVSAPIVSTSSDSQHAEKNLVEKMSEITIKESDISSDNLALVLYVEPTTVFNGNGNTTVDSSDSSDIFSWLDYVDPTTVSSDQKAAADVSDYMNTDEAILQQVIEASKSDSNGLKETLPLTDYPWPGYLEPSSSSNDHYMASRNEDLPVVHDSVDLNGLKEAPPSTDDSLLDFLEPCSSSNDHNMVSQNEYPPAVETSNDLWQDDHILHQVIEASKLDSNGFKETPPLTDDTWLYSFEPKSSSDDHIVAPQSEDSSVVHDSGTFNDVWEDEPILQQVIDASKFDSNGLKETPPLIDDSWLYNLEPSSLSNDHNMAPQNEDPPVVQNDVWEDKPQLIKDSEVILLPFEELTSTSNGNGVTSSSVSGEIESLDIDGFGCLFDEPEVVYGPALGPLSNGVVENGCESDSDEVDNTYSQVSVDKCLAFFTASELLTKTEHAWNCEQCSKALVEQKTMLKNKLQECVSNGAENGNSNSHAVAETPLSNGSHNDKSDCGGVITSELEEKGSLLNCEESCMVQDTDSCQANGSSDNCKDEKVVRRVSKRLAMKKALNGVENGLNGVKENGAVDSSSVKVIRDASKRILINKVPPILTIHLKRLSQDARGRLSKLNGHVDFKEIIDLKPYIDPGCCKDRETYNYRLVGVVEHLGTTRGGHYVAYVRGAAKGNDDCVWYHASDAHVRQVSLEEVLRCEAYILFYEEM